MAQNSGQRYRRHRKQRQLPEIAAPLQPRPSQRLDDLDQHDTTDDKGEQFRHAAFDQQRWRLSKLFLSRPSNEIPDKNGLTWTHARGAGPPSSLPCHAPDRLLSVGMCDIRLIKKERSEDMNGFTILRSVQHYVGRIRTVRNEIRTQRFLNTLPADIRKDIGWPDLYTGRVREN
ncbi:hypothetical protein P9272_14880 [Mesorhizobium sp. WSM4976]|nr:hypothetical protein [Mesorhizobium sp. WSM4976]MDG4894853.1 hypothetical protein [Mesorhizobium sp. WSM4976]